MPLTIPTRTRGAAQVSLASFGVVETTVYAEACRALANRRTLRIHDAKVRNLHKATAPGSASR